VNTTALHSEICALDVSAIVTWLHESEKPWHQTASPVKPTRVFEPDLPGGVLFIAYTQILPEFSGVVKPDAPMLSRMKPGQSHGYHVDRQRPGWITRVHVPIVTNPQCWMMFEEEDGVKVHFEAGKAYTFNAVERHAFANEGETDRVHLIFDVLESDPC